MRSWRWDLVLGIVLAAAPAVPAQQFAPRIGYVYPAGGRQGATIPVTLGGQFLDGATGVYVSGAGVQATVIEHVKPITQQQFNQLREQLQKLMEQRAAAMRGGRRSGDGRSPPDQQPAWTAAEEKQVADIRKQIGTFVRRPANPAIAETVALQITLAGDTEPGQRELRLGTSQGLTNPLVFHVGQLPEFSKPLATSPPDPRFLSRLGVQPRGTPAGEARDISLPAVLNGQIMPGGVDRYRFTARRGDRLVVAAQARQLIPYLPDAVPGWFQATLTLYDAAGQELAYDDDYRFHPDPVLFQQIPADGQYVIEIKDSIYRGREDFVYRLSIGALPFVTSHFPLGGRAGTESSVELQGWNLPLPRLTRAVHDQTPGIHPLLVRDEGRLSNRLPFAVDTLPEVREVEANDTPATAQPLTLPIIVNGRVDPPGDRDVFRFAGRAGQAIVAEVYARRLDSPLDSVLKLTDASGRPLAVNDDFEDPGAGLTTHHADSHLSVTLPADGDYCVHLGDAQRKGGTEYAYRLRISPPRPDFELRVVPSSVNVRAGLSVPVTVYALRRDDFADDIALELRDPPPGFRLSGGGVPSHQDKVRLTVTASPDASDQPVRLRLEGRAVIQGREVRHAAVPADDVMQAFFYRHLVPAQEWLATASGRGRFGGALRLLGEQPTRLPAGGTAEVRFAMPARPFSVQMHLALSDPPDGIAIRSVSPGREGVAVVLSADAAKVKPGLKGNLIVEATVERTAGPPDAKGQANRRRIPVGTLPAIAFEIVAPHT